MRGSKRPRRFGAIAAAVFAIFVMGGSVAQADTPISHTGLYGAHHLIDTATSTGATCYYHFLHGAIDSISVRPPVVYARNTTAARNSQYVGWRFRIERSSYHGAWTQIYASGLQKRLAYDDTRAAFTRMSFSPGASNFEIRYRVKVVMYWFRPSTTVEGTAVHRVDRYRLIEESTGGPNYVPPEGWCHGNEP